MTQDTKAPERIWAVTGLYYTYVQDWSEGEWCQNGDDGVEYVRADLLTAAEARAEAAGAERDADRKLLAECEDWIERADKARLDVIAERDRLVRLVEDARRTLQDSEESIVTFMGVHGYSTDSGAQLVLDEVRATLAKMENTDD